MCIVLDVGRKCGGGWDHETNGDGLVARGVDWNGKCVSGFLVMVGMGEYLITNVA